MDSKWIALSAVIQLAAANQAFAADQVRPIEYTKLIPLLSCETTRVARVTTRALSGGIDFAEALRPSRSCNRLKMDFALANARVRSIPPDRDTTDTRSIEKWSMTVGHLCWRVLLIEGLNPKQAVCVFGVPSRDQPTASMLWESYLHHSFPDGYNGGSWCMRSPPYQCGDQRDVYLRSAFDSPNGAIWEKIKPKLEHDGFYQTQSNRDYLRFVTFAGDQDGTFGALPLISFDVYEGQERRPRMPELCPAGQNCAIAPAPQLPDGVCVSVQAGWGP